MRCGTLLVQKTMLWIIKAVDFSTRRTVACVTGNRDASNIPKALRQMESFERMSFYIRIIEMFYSMLHTMILCESK